MTKIPDCSWSRKNNNLKVFDRQMTGDGYRVIHRNVTDYSKHSHQTTGSNKLWTHQILHKWSPSSDRYPIRRFGGKITECSSAELGSPIYVYGVYLVLKWIPWHSHCSSGIVMLSVVWWMQITALLFISVLGSWLLKSGLRVSVSTEALSKPVVTVRMSWESQ